MFHGGILDVHYGQSAPEFQEIEFVDTSITVQLQLALLIITRNQHYDPDSLQCLLVFC